MDSTNKKPDDIESEGSVIEKSKRGFASMDEDRQREIASKGGKAAHQKGTAHEFDSIEAQEAGRKGGQARQQMAKAIKEGAPHGLDSAMLEADSL